MKLNKNNTDNQDELFIVVNLSDKIIGYRTRYDCHHNKTLVHRVIGVVVFNDQGELLIQKRSKNKDTYPGFYTVSASGHVSKGQTYKQAAVREVEEELGINVTLKKEVMFLLEMEIETEMICLFSAKYNGPFYPNKEEVDDVKFISPKQLKQMQKQLTPFAQTSLKKLNLLP